MSTRSRTGLFLSYRESTARRDYHDGHEHQRLINHAAIDIPSDLPPVWVDVSDQVEALLADTTANIAALDKLHAKHILPSFADRSQEERDIDALTTQITKDFRTCHSLIQRISTTFPPSHEANPAKNVQRGLAAKVQHLSATFRKKQRVYMDKLQGHATKNQDLLLASGAISLKASDAMSALDDDIQAASHTTLLYADPSTQHLQSRDRELAEIAKSIASLAELFKDLSVLVIDQGTLLDSVEYNIEQTAVHMEDAVEILNHATRYQKNTGRRKCIFLLLLIIFGLIIVLIFKPKRKSLPPPVSPP
ncbi:t-SNARE affecting a late Golgi compartment protein 2 [Psilocybe cubensis]|uniref:t-SNARE affecting a late Golgi compartment protein 2 n=2 Tax=Psilocybe cubensis TaxID=181762 RepID=A0ACB8HE15_PSICU|nr:t-SNARE affecting a late Golgi compartment protein 2 [Psilocybe cubensis]KAH9485390.1 t-SNARE affecting a late Golgi compartment protein 2 [Psilocybe cubensis]